MSMDGLAAKLTDLAVLYLLLGDTTSAQRALEAAEGLDSAVRNSEAAKVFVRDLETKAASAAGS